MWERCAGEHTGYQRRSYEIPISRGVFLAPNLEPYIDDA